MTFPFIALAGSFEFEFDLLWAISSRNSGKSKEFITIKLNWSNFTSKDSFSTIMNIEIITYLTCHLCSYILAVET